MHLELNLEAIKSIVIVSTVRMTHKTNKIKKPNRINQLIQLMKMSGTRARHKSEHTHL